MKRAISLFLVIVLAAAMVALPPPQPAEAGGNADAALVIGGIALLAVIGQAIFAKPAPAAVIYQAPQAPPPAPIAVEGARVSTSSTVVYPQDDSSRGGLAVANAMPVALDIFINSKLRVQGLPPGDVARFPDVYGSGSILARTPDRKFAERRYYVNGDSAPVVLGVNDFR